ncbi:MAG: SCO family protein [Chloroflexi bacterium]|nr:SCO family protein [Chloroflexota bacterium]
MKTKRVSFLLGILLYGLLAGMLLGIAALALFLIQDRMRASESVPAGPFEVVGSATFDGVLAIDPPVDMPEFTLSDSMGDSVRLADFRGRHALLTFGFTHCPDICPLTLNDFERIRRLLGDSADSIAFVFISVDGARDTPAALRQYFEFRQLDHIKALTGDEDSVRTMGEPLGLSFEINEEDSAGGYMINHTSGAFLLDQAGRWIKRYQFGVPPETVAADLRELLG